MTNIKYLLILMLATFGLATAAGCGSMNSVPEVIVYHDVDGDVDMISSSNQPLVHGQPALPPAGLAPGQPALPS